MSIDEERFAAWRADIGLPATTTLNPDVLDEITSSVADVGLPLKVALNAAGVNQATWKGWCSKYPLIQDLMDQARAKWQRKKFKQLQDANPDIDPKSWTRVAWALERTDPENFAQRGPEGGDSPKLVVQIGKADNVDIKALIADGLKKEINTIETKALPSPASEES